MKNRGLYILMAFAVGILLVGLACFGGETVPPTAVPQPTQPPAPTAVPATAVPPTSAVVATQASSSNGLLTFTDQNNLYAIDVPSDWTHTHDSGEHYYWDTFKSPDGGAVVENYMYDDGEPWSGKDSGKYALAVLNQLYSKTGQEGDIRVSEEKVQQDGSDRLTWTSKSGGYSGISFFEIRSRTTFLMFTVNWGNGYKDKYIDVLNKVIESYRVP